MATLKPFAALRPKLGTLASQICELPYDVMSSDEAREIAAGKPLSFLHVSKPEIDLARETDIYAPEVYAKGKENFQKLITQGALKQDDKPNFYLYRQIMGGHIQIGLVAAASCEEYNRGIIKKHEFTRPDKEDDRVRHIETLNSQTGPVFLTYKAVAEMDDYVNGKTGAKPDIDFTAKDGVRHTSWNISNPKEIQNIEKLFAKIPYLYTSPTAITSERCRRACVSIPQSIAGHSGQLLTVIFPHNQMQILPYNRALKDLNGHTIPGTICWKSSACFACLILKAGPGPKPNINWAFISKASGTRSGSARSTWNPPMPSKISTLRSCKSTSSVRFSALMTRARVNASLLSAAFAVLMNWKNL